MTTAPTGHRATIRVIAPDGVLSETVVTRSEFVSWGAFRVGVDDAFWNVAFRHRDGTVELVDGDGRICNRVEPVATRSPGNYDDIGHDRAEQRQQAAEDGVQFFDEDDWYDDLAGMDLEDQFDALLDGAIRAEIDAELDALHAEAATYREAGIDPQLAMWMARHRMAG